jgi:NADPH:quinone reductase-like Zn-dependent oxidoreductase
MRYWSFDTGFGYENLVLREAETPRPGPRDVLLEMRAASLNFRDLVVLNGQHGRRVQPPLIPLSDGVGIVDRDRGRRHRPAPRRPRRARFFQNWEGGPPPADLEAGRLGGPLDGVLATHRVFPARGVVRVPDHLTDAEAATLPCAGVTAWSALCGEAPRPTRAKPCSSSAPAASRSWRSCWRGRRARGRSSPPRGRRPARSRLRALGADHVIDRSATPDWAAEARALTGRAMASTGCWNSAARPRWAHSIRATRTGAQIILIGNVTGNAAELFLPAILTRQLTLRAVTVGPKAHLAALSQARCPPTRFTPSSAARFSFAEAPDAFRALEAGQSFGNVCIEIGDPG